jgi:hypothetical protein
MGIARDDRILPFTRIVSAGVIIILLLAFLVLYVEPDHTDRNFSWTITPRTSAILIGAGYTAGAYFFACLLGQKKWHRVQAGFLPITAFTVCMFAATLLHWGRFHQGSLAFYLWTIIYAITPFLVPYIWWRNHATESKELEVHDLKFGSSVRWGLGIIATIGILSFLVIFFKPSILISLAPWKLTELTARVFSGWSILTLATVMTIAIDGRWSAARILFESAMVGLALTLISLPRMWNDLDKTRPMTFIFVAAIVLTLVAFIIIHAWLDKSSRKGLKKD